MARAPTSRRRSLPHRAHLRAQAGQARRGGHRLRAGAARGAPLLARVSRARSAAATRSAVAAAARGADKQADGAHAGGAGAGLPRDRADLRAAPARSEGGGEGVRAGGQAASPYEAAVAALAQVHEARGQYEALEQLYSDLLARTQTAAARVSVLTRLGPLCELRLADPGRAALFYREASRRRRWGSRSGWPSCAPRGSTAARADGGVAVALGARTTDKRLAHGYRTLAALRDEVRRRAADAAVVALSLDAAALGRQDPGVGDGLIRALQRAPATTSPKERLADALVERATRAARRRRARCCCSRRRSCSSGWAARATRRSRTRTRAARCPIFCRCCAACGASPWPTSSGRRWWRSWRARPKWRPTPRIAPPRSWRRRDRDLPAQRAAHGAASLQAAARAVAGARARVPSRDRALRAARRLPGLFELLPARTAATDDPDARAASCGGRRSSSAIA